MHACFLEQPAGLILCFIPVHIPCSTQWDIRIICLTSRKVNGAPHAQVPLRPVMILLKYAACVTAATPVTHLSMSAPLRYSSPVTPLQTHPPQTHTHTQTQQHWGQGRGVQSWLRCKTLPACFNFHLPHYDPLQLVTQVASCCTSPLLSVPYSYLLNLVSSPVFPTVLWQLYFSSCVHITNKYLFGVAKQNE